MKDRLQQKIFLTSEGLNKIQKEYNALIDTKRKEVIERIAKAREYGDISENSEYDSAREEQSFIEGRILELGEILKNSSVVEVSTQKGIVNIGSKVVVGVDGQKDEFVIVSSVEANPLEGKISNESIVGRALMGAKIGDVITVASTIKATYTILEIK